MKKKNLGVLFLFISLLLMLTACFSNKALNLKNDNGDFSKSKLVAIKSTYEYKSKVGFFFNIDFDLKAGKVDWVVTNPKGVVVFKGYAVNENGITYRQLTYPTNYDVELNQKQEAKPDKDGAGNTRSKPDFSCSLYGNVSTLGKFYTLTLSPTNAEGKYTVLWSDGMVKD